MFVDTKLQMQLSALDNDIPEIFATEIFFSF